MILVPGIAAFALFILFDINKIRWHNRFLNLLFAVGSLLLAVSTVMCILAGDLQRIAWNLRTILGLTGLALSLAGLVYALFFALPFQSTYAESEAVPVISTGIYGMCRHPGFWPFLTAYFSLWITFGGIWLQAALIAYPLCNGIYIWIQDRYIFPQYIQGYDQYRQNVPFLIPRRKQ